MPHVKGSGGVGPSKGGGNSKPVKSMPVGHAPSKPVINVPADADPLVISNSTPNVICPELFAACRAGKVERVRRLLSHPGVCGTTADSKGRTCFHAACSSGQVEVVEALLEEIPSLLTQTALDGFTPLMAACDLGQVKVARLLVGSKVNPDEKSNDGSTALMAASERGSSDCIDFLLSECKVDVDSRNEEGYTALLRASQEGRTAVVKILLDAGADSTATLVVGTTALGLAKAGDHDATAKALETHAKLQARRSAKGAKGAAPASAVLVDDGRSLDDLMAELEGGDDASKKKKKSKAKPDVSPEIVSPDATHTTEASTTNDSHEVAVSSGAQKKKRRPKKKKSAGEGQEQNDDAEEDGEGDLEN